MCRHLVAAGLALFIASPGLAVDFLGIKLCKGGVSTSVKMPEGSALKIESVSLGKYGALVMLLSTEKDDILPLIDDLMTSYTGSPGSGDQKKLQWSGGKLFAYASVKKNGQAALAVSTSDDCLAEATPVAAPMPEAQLAPEPKPAAAVPEPAEEAPKPASAPAAVAVAAAAAPEATTGFELRGTLKHTPAEDAWVDVMGVVVNSSGNDYQLASFDLSFFDADGNLICVDTISVSELKNGQQRPFRDSIQCPEYGPDTVASHQLHFAGGY